MTGPASSILVTLGVDSSELAPGLDAAKAQVQAAQDQMNASGQAATDAMAASTAAPADAWDALAAQITASADAAKAAIAEMAGAAVAPLDLMLAATSGTAASVADLNVVVTQLNTAFEAGTVSAADLAEAETALQIQFDGIVASATAAATAETNLIAAQMAQTTAWAEQDAAIAANTGELTANTAAREGNAAAGGGKFHFRGLYGTISEGLNALMSPAGAAIAAIAGLGGVMAYGAEKTADLNEALANTGSYAGVTAADVETMAREIAGSSMSVGTASSALQALALSGHITGSDLMAAGQAAADMASLTNESMAKAVGAIEKLGEDPLKASVALTDQLHYLSAAEYEQIAKLEAEGNASGAATEAINAIRDAEARRVAAMNQDEPAILHWLQEEVHGWENLGHAMISAAPDGEMVKRNQLATELNALYHQDPGGFTRTAAGVVSFSNANHYFTDNVMGRWSASHAAHVVAEWNALNAKITAEHDKIARGAAVTTGENAAQALAPLIHGFDKVADRADAAKKVTAELMDEVRAGLPLPDGVEQIGRTFSGPGFDYLVNKTAGEMPHAVHITSAHATHDYPDLTSWVPQSVTNELMRTQQTQVDEALAVTKTTESSQAAHQVAMQQMKQQHIQAMVSMGTMGHSTAIAQEQAIQDKIYQIKLAELEKEKALAATKPEEVARINSEIVRLQDSHTATMISLADAASAIQIKDAQGQVSPTLSAFAQITAGFVEGTLTRQQAELRVGEAIVAHEIQWGMQKLINHITIDNAKTLVTAEGEAKRVALTMAAEAEAAAVHALHAVEWIITEAAKAAASAFSAMAGIPIIGPALAVGVSIAAGAEVLALVGQVSSAAGGWERVPMDNAPALLHKDEMVLPADLAEGIRSMTGSGAGSGETHLHFHAVDGPSMSAWFQRNPRVLLDALGHAHRTGHAA
jgi:hypothetical protein